jgi:predicted permease
MGSLKAAVRGLLRAPQLAATTTAIVGVGLGSAIAMFSVVDGVLLDPLRYPDGERLVAVWERDPAVPQTWLNASPLAAGHFMRQARSFDAVAAGRNASSTFTSFEDGDTPLLRVVSHRYFELTGSRPLLGRTFSAEEDRPGAAPVMLLAYSTWQRRFGGREDVLGQTTELDGRAHTIVGVMPAEHDDALFQTDARPAAWVPLALPEAGLDARPQGLVVLGRLAPGRTLSDARAELSALSDELRRTHPAWTREAHVVPAAERLVRGLRAPVWLLFGAVLLLLLVACGNVANLLLARAVERGREMALRQALGAGNGHLLRQLLAEGLLLSALACLAGLGLARAALPGLRALLPANGPGFTLGLDGPVLAFALAACATTGVVFGLMPAVHALRENPGSLLSAGAVRATAGGSRRLLRRGLVVAEVALSLVLLASAALLVRSYERLQAMDPGFATKDRLVYRLSTRGERYTAPAERARFFAEVERELAAEPGVEGVGAVQFLPLFASFGQRRVGTEAAAVIDEQGLRAPVLRASPGFFEAFGLKRLAGRTFDERDAADAPPVAVVSRELARSLWPNGDPVGQTVHLGAPQKSYAVVGVVGDVRADQSPGTVPHAVYLALAQEPDPTAMTFVLHASGDTAQRLALAERAARRVDRGMPVYLAQPLEELLSAVDAGRRTLRSLISGFAAIALLLAVSGLYAVLSYEVARRGREMGIRAALGATRARLVGDVVGEAARLGGLGLGLGLALTAAAAGALRAQLYAIEPGDPGTLTGVSLVLALVVVAASALPAWRAARVDPAVALRVE